MDPSLVNQVVVASATLLAAGGGYWLAGVNERRRDARTLERELRLREAEREARLVDATRAFQRETLLALQDAVQLMARLTGQATFFDHMKARAGMYTRLPDELSDDLYANGVEVRSLMSRVLSVEVRDAVDRFVELSVRLTTSPKHLEGLVGDDLERHAATQTIELNTAYISVTGVLGEALRRELVWRPAGLAE